MSAEEIEAYVRELEEPKRSTLQTLRATILETLPEAEEGISYRVPAFRVARGRGGPQTLTRRARSAS